MVLGTSSHVGKSLLTAALCRIFAQQGYRVAPFKSQNMSLNSAATIEGLEIGRAQALQAEAAGIAASVHMNPVLIKPSGDCSSQVVVRGKIWGQISAADYHQRRVEELMPAVCESYQTLASSFQVIILEGAGSPAEINLKQHDIANMRMAEMATPLASWWVTSIAAESSLPCWAQSSCSIRLSAIAFAASASTNFAATSACWNQASA
jgi:adenosylcobyric acid synthase